MLWQLGHFRFCDNKHLLWRADAQELLEPKQAEVLAYFCRHPGRLISRDEFIAEVWQGQIVTDNAINRVIARLRKSLDDPAKGSQFIITLPKKGYRFIAPVELLNTPAPTKCSESPTEFFAPANPAGLKSSPLVHRTMLVKFSALLLITALLLVVGLHLHDARHDRSQQEPEATAYQLSPLTRESGEEQQPALSPDGRFLIYNSGTALYLKDLISNQVHQLNIGSGSPGDGDWSKDGLRYVFFSHTPERCDLNIVEFQRASADRLTTAEQLPQPTLDLLQVEPPQAVHQCPTGSYGNVRFSHDGQSLIFSQKQTSGGSYQIYLKNLRTGQLRLPKQPALVLAGNVEFDLHPRKEQLLIASPDLSQQLAYYMLDLPSNQLRHLFNKNDWLCCPVWEQSGEAIWQTDASPASQILRFSLDGALQATMFSSSHDIRELRRGHDGQTYIYSGWTTRREILYQKLPAGQTTRLIHSSVSESLPTLSRQKQWLAFVSERSGSREVWLHRLSNGQVHKLSNFTTNDWIYDLQWSPDDQQLAVLLSSEIQIVDITSGQAQRLALPAQQIRGISWVNSQTLAMSLQQQQQWRLFHYQLASGLLKPQPAQWAYGHYDGSTQPPVLIDQQQKVIRNGQPLAVKLNGINSRSRRLPFSVWRDQLYFLHAQPDSGKTQLMQFQFNTSQTTAVAEVPADTLFSIGGDGVYFTKDEPAQADVFKLSPVKSP